jgi:hypothetical protein
MNGIRKASRKLFFVSARQVRRRWRTYLSVFVTSVVLLMLVMTALELFESYWLQSVETASIGTHHIAVLDQLYDFGEEISGNGNVVQVRVIPSGSRLASSVDASAPAKVAVETEGLDRVLGVRYLWGGPPGGGEIAVPLDLYRASDWLTADEENDLWFTATRMTYYPLTVSGVFTVSGGGGGYVFVSRKDALAIDAETGAKTKYDHYITVKHPSVLMAGKVLTELFRDIPLRETDAQRRNPEEEYTADKWEDYLNLKYLEMQTRYKAAPVSLAVLPVAALAALILASFMIEWCRSHMEEFGALAAMGATRPELSAVAAGQILIISLISSVPVVLLSALLSNVYLSVYNGVAEGEVGFVFSVPWVSLIKAALHFTLLAVVFTFLGTARLMKSPPFPLLAGSADASRPVFHPLTEKLFQKLSPKTALALRMTLRRIRSEWVSAAVNALVSAILGAFVLIMVLSQGETDRQLSILNRTVSAADVRISMRTDTGTAALPLTDGMAEWIRCLPAVESCSAVSVCGGSEPVFRLDPVNPNRKIAEEPLVRLTETDENGRETSSMWLTRQTVIADGGSFRLITEEADGDAFLSLLSDDAGVIALVPTYREDPDLRSVSVGDLLEAVPEFRINQKGVIVSPDSSAEFTVRAVLPLKRDQNLIGQYGETVFVFSPAGGERLGLSPADEHTDLLVNFDPDADEETVRSTVEALNSRPNLLRYKIDNRAVRSEAEKKTGLVKALMLCFFLVSVLLAFCVTSWLNAAVRASRNRKEYAVLRQLGADERDVVRHARREALPGIALSFLIAAAVLLTAAALYLLLSMYDLNVRRDEMPGAYTPAVYGRFRDEIFRHSSWIALTWVYSLPFQIITALLTLAGVTGPVKKLVKHPVAEELRKDTD